MDSEQERVAPYPSIATDISAGGSSRSPAAEPAHESESDLLWSRNHYRRVVEALSEGVFVQDRLGKMLTVNSAAAKILGLDLGQLTGMNTAGLAWDIVDEHGSRWPPTTVRADGASRPASRRSARSSACAWRVER